MPGTATLAAEATHVSQHGLWLLPEEEERLLSFDQVPWCRKAAIDQRANVERPTREHVDWPDFDIALSLASIRNPGAFPLVTQRID